MNYSQKAVLDFAKELKLYCENGGSEIRNKGSKNNIVWENGKGLINGKWIESEIENFISFCKKNGFKINFKS